MGKHYFPQSITAPIDPVMLELVGCGGTGCQILSGLARINASLQALGHPGLKVMVYDPDIVTEANIGRQLFSPADIGRYKAEVMVTRVNNFYGFGWEAIPEYYDVVKRKYNNGSYGFLIAAVDTAPARLRIAKAIKRKLYYHLDTGNTRHTGQVILGTTKNWPQPKGDVEAVGKLPTVTDLYDLKRAGKDKFQGPSCSLAVALQQQDLMINQMVATCALQILWQGFRYGVLYNHGAFVDLNNMKVNPLPIDPKVWERIKNNN